MKKSRNQELWLACGENCMPIDILRRFDLNAPSTPFSSCRSNIEHLHYLEKSNYIEYLNSDYIIEANSFSERCYLNLVLRSCGNFIQGRHRYLEFTHHNPNNESDSLILQRRIDRQIKARMNSTPVIFFYHHRSSTGFKNMETKITKHFQDILSFYKNARALCYSQNLVKNDSERKVEIKKTSNDKIHFATFYTEQAWGGYDKDRFFGRHENKLFQQLISWYKQTYISQYN
ncbi:DUF1796 family putative cysteine peptidase [Prochlorococcus marinus]|uniref:DUF1796 family putative cysteine peptidase n=1 Tax=Prochlorococcus marinus TaxID=1219 RepID=UPI0007BAFB84|nr:DUF1796 family putative cysteine peptidase [Prochlorococcus marinus]KZR73698.1 hypothetical protein PMIT1320_02293 [Prochlorococcus marinus str. MIT 1320]